VFGSGSDVTAGCVAVRNALTDAKTSGRFEIVCLDFDTRSGVTVGIEMVESVCAPFVMLRDTAPVL
jgi:hypothetical protein